MGFSNIKIIMTLVVLTLLGVPSIMALSVSSPYWDNNPLVMSPGEIREISFTIANKETDPTTTALVTLKESGGITQLISGTEYSVIPGGNTKVKLRISIPENANAGDKYDIEFVVKSVPQEEGTIQLGISYNIGFPIQIVEETVIIPESDKKPINLVPWILSALIVIVIIVVVINRKR